MSETNGLLVFLGISMTLNALMLVLSGHLLQGMRDAMAGWKRESEFWASIAPATPPGPAKTGENE